MNTPLAPTPVRLRRLTPDDVKSGHRTALEARTLAAASAIVDDVRSGGWDAVLHHARRLGDLRDGEPAIYGPAELRAALGRLPADDRRVLEAAADRIGGFAAAQRRCLVDLDLPITGGAAGHRLIPAAAAGCYAPGGRFPLPSSVLMTAVTARAAGVPRVWVASPHPTDATLAAGAIAGADGLLAVGGAQAIAALAFGAGDVPACDVVVGPGNRWVTAAKHAVSPFVGIDMLAGPSEILILADDSADAGLVAADLLAQAEHDHDATPILVTTSSRLADAVDEVISRLLPRLATAPIAEPALRNGFAVIVPDLDAAAAVADRIAPEHLELMTREDDRLAAVLRNYGALFIGSRSAEVLGDYGAGPNHVLPTGGTARFASGLSVLNFLRLRTWLRIGSEAESRALCSDAAALARLEGLAGHALAAEARGAR